jgi:16S rRNA G966 N2-methylase RsmD
MKNNQRLTSNKTELDQFYTNPLTVKKLTSIFTEKLKKLGYQKNISLYSEKDLQKPQMNLKTFKSKIIVGDVIKVLKKLVKKAKLSDEANNKFDVIIADPPYNIKKNFGNNIDYRELKNYIN